eukprot:TRINITY_DN7140_c0_g1_i1.p1 TRINITY_DN7140_c0_g1~~TRINITY_DN7140_c0_g1_i1.p1  ORF type:complete len:712 (+),score=128.59 TRINITY_DN7140_c0_g1_i1:56-2191(+)
MSMTASRSVVVVLLAVCASCQPVLDDAEDQPLDTAGACTDRSVGKLLQERLKYCESECCPANRTTDCYCFDELNWELTNRHITLPNKENFLVTGSTKEFCEYGECLHKIVDECRAVGVENALAQFTGPSAFLRAIRKQELQLYCPDAGSCHTFPNATTGHKNLQECLESKAECFNDNGQERCTHECMQHNMDCANNFNCRQSKTVRDCNVTLPFTSMCRAECPEGNLDCQNLLPLCSGILDSSDDSLQPAVIALIIVGSFVACFVIFVFVALRWLKNKRANEDKALAPPCKDATPVIVSALVNGSWSKGRLLGRGQFGSVYLVLLSTGKSLAAKQIDTSNVKEFEMQSYVKEITTMRDLEHPNIVKYYYASYNRKEALMTLFMEFVPGGSLGKLVRSMGSRLSEEQASVYLRQIVSGIGYLHTKGIIHRDIKGDNVLVDTNEGVCKISDFGSAKQLGGTLDRTVAKTVTGTPNWMAPEVITNAGTAEHSAKVDIWSIGCTAVEILDEGRPPWPVFETHWAAIYHIGKADATPDIPGWMSYDCKDFVSQCLQRDPTLRPSCDLMLGHAFLRRGLHVESELSEDESVPSVDSNVDELIKRKAFSPSVSNLGQPAAPSASATARGSTDPTNSLQTAVNPSFPTTTTGTMRTSKSLNTATDGQPSFSGQFSPHDAPEDSVRFTANFQSAPHGAGDTVNFTTIPHNDRNKNTEPFS